VQRSTKEIPVRCKPHGYWAQGHFMTMVMTFLTLVMIKMTLVVTISTLVVSICDNGSEFYCVI